MRRSIVAATVDSVPTDSPSPPDSGNRRRFLQGRGAELASELDIDVSAYKVSGHVHSVFTLMRAMMERGPLAEANLSLTAFIALWSIWVNGDMEAREVAAEIGIARSSFSELANRLEQRGLLSRHADSRDGRVVVFRVTDAGRTTIQTLWPQLNADVSRMCSILDENQRSTLVDHLGQVADQLEEMASE